MQSVDPPNPRMDGKPQNPYWTQKGKRMLRHILKDTKLIQDSSGRYSLISGTSKQTDRGEIRTA